MRHLRITINFTTMKTRRLLSIFAALTLAATSVFAQNSAPAPGSGGAFTPNTSYGPGYQGAGFGPGVPMWGSSPSMMNGGPWGPGAFSGPYYNNGPGYNQGIMRLVAVGYDAQGVWETVPIVVSYDWNGFYYDVTVVNAFNPWTRMWEGQMSIPAFQTQYTLRGVPYSFYVNLSTGTYYFNL